MLSHAGLPDSYWAEAVATAAYVKNRLPTVAIKEDKTPYERWYGRKSNISHLRVFGCMAYSHTYTYIGNRSRKKMFADFMNLIAFMNIFLHYFLYDSHFLVLITKFVNVFSGTL